MDDVNRLGQIRDLLVGPQMQSLENRVCELTERMDHELRMVREEMNEKSVSLESLIRQEVGELHQQLAHSRTAQEESAQQFAAGSAELLSHVTQTKKSFDDQFSTITSELRHSINDQVARVQSDLSTQNDELRYELMELVDRVDRGKVDRETVGQVLHQLADRLGIGIGEEDRMREPVHQS